MDILFYFLYLIVYEWFMLKNNTYNTLTICILYFSIFYELQIYPIRMHFFISTCVCHDAKQITPCLPNYSINRFIKLEDYKCVGSMQFLSDLMLF